MDRVEKQMLTQLYRNYNEYYSRNTMIIDLFRILKNIILKYDKHVA